ncbi:MAG: tyrosine-type recombinase/integrase [Candidatus Bathyarchaeia archaeon]|jgi:integrase
MESQAVIRCPECNKDRIFKDGIRKLSNGEQKQRFICRSCGYRFTDTTSLNVQDNNKANSQICATIGAKNLEPVQKTKGKLFCAGDAKLSADTKGLLTQFYAYLEKEAYSVESDYVDKVKHLAVLGANLRDPEHVKTVIGHMQRKDGQKTKNGTKMLYCYAYDAFVKMLKIQWDMPTYVQEDHDPFVPDETELDALISSAKSKLLAVFLQSLKETFGDPGEVLRIKWLDVDTNNKAISIRYPVKNHLPRTLNVSNRLLAMIEALPKKDDRVFPTSYANMLRRFVTMRKRTADIHQNPRLLAVDFTAFRTWAGTMIAYHTNGNVLTVKKLLGHKQVKNTMKYIGKIQFQSQDFETTSASTVEDILKLGSQGWIEYSVAKINNVEYHCFKKPKRFSTYV